MANFNGYTSWNAWNVSLWVNNDEGLYNHARDMVRRYGSKEAVRRLAEEFDGQKTPDGAEYNITALRQAVVGIL